MANPFDMDDLLGAYALDALDEDERRAVEDYLAVSPRARAEVQEHREAATMLAWSGMDAPDGLWERIAGSLDGREVSPAEQLGDVMSLGAARRRRRRPTRVIGAWVAATAAAALIAVVAVRVSTEDDITATASVADAALAALADPSLLHAQLAADGDPGLKVLAVVDNDGVGYLLADDLPVLGGDRTYQLWGRVDGTLISLGILGADPGTAVFTVRDDVDLLAITDEEKGGVTSSSNQAVVVGPLA